MNNTIAVLTSGGDCGGLNAVVKGAALMAKSLGIKVFAIKNGYAGLYNLENENNITELTDRHIDDIDILAAGSKIGNSRVKISKIDDAKKYEKIKRNLKARGITGLIISGGDDTGSVVLDLVKQGIPCVHAPKTMDLDLMTYSVGGDSAVNNIASEIRALKTTGFSHNRVIVVEAFGRYAGHTSFLGGIAGQADAILLPEVAVDIDAVYEHMKQRFLKRLTTSEFMESTYIIVASEGLRIDNALITDDSLGSDAFGHKKTTGIAKYIRDELSRRLSDDVDFEAAYKRLGLYVEGMNVRPEVRDTAPGYLIRSGNTSAYDAFFGISIGAGAVMLINQGIYGVTVSGIDNGTVCYCSTEEIVKQRFVAKEMIEIYEQLGVCFGRYPIDKKTEIQTADKTVWKYF